MDDLTGKISQLLSDPSALEQLKNFGSLLGVQPEQQKEPESQPPINADTMQTVMKLMPLLGSMKEEDDNVRLLKALRPFLGDERQKKLDEAIKMLGFMKLLPMLKNLGGLGGIF